MPKNFMPMVHIALVYIIHGYNVNMYYTIAKNVKHKDNLTMLMVQGAVSVVWFCYELMIFGNKKCKIIIKFSK